MKFLYTNFPKQYGKLLYLKSIIFLWPKIILLKADIEFFWLQRSG